MQILRGKSVSNKIGYSQIFDDSLTYFGTFDLFLNSYEIRPIKNASNPKQYFDSGDYFSLYCDVYVHLSLNGSGPLSGNLGSLSENLSTAIGTNYPLKYFNGMNVYISSRSLIASTNAGYNIFRNVKTGHEIYFDINYASGYNNFIPTSIYTNNTLTSEDFDSDSFFNGTLIIGDTNYNHNL